MAKSRGVDAKLARLRALRAEPVTPALVAELRDLLADKSNFVVAGAAEIVGERMLADLAPEMVAAFERFLIDPAETDKTCRAKIAITEALNKIEYDREEVFRAGLRHVQMEPRWGGSDDTAPPLRGAAAFALVRTRPRDLVVLLADLLADPEKVARSAAARALGASGLVAAIPLLRFKARVGDAEPDVIAECLNTLMAAEPEESLPFVGEFLQSPVEEVAEGAALALGESRRAGGGGGSLRKGLLVAISIRRLPAALDFLMEVLGEKNEADASAAISALGIHRHNPAVKERVAAVMAKKGRALREQFEKEFRAKQ